MLIDGNPTFLSTWNVVAFTAVAVPGLLFSFILSNWVSTQTCPTPGADGGTGANRSLGSPKAVRMAVLRFVIETGLPSLS